MKHEKLRPLIFSDSMIQANANCSLALSLSLSPLNENPIQIITEIHITLHATLIIFIFNLGLSVCLTYRYNFNSDSIISYLLCNASKRSNWRKESVTILEESSENWMNFGLKMMIWITTSQIYEWAQTKWKFVRFSYV